MDFRSDHLDDDELLKSPSFLYAMDLGNETYFCIPKSLGSKAPIIGLRASGLNM